MSAENRLQAIDVHSHWSTRLGYPLQTEAELAQQERTWRSKPAYRTEAEMAEDFRDAGVGARSSISATPNTCRSRRRTGSMTAALRPSKSIPT
jgi:hypothetical protein